MWLSLVVVLSGCWEPRESSDKALVGHILGPLDIPERGLAVESLEARDVTDAEGHFAVQFKPPNQAVRFRWKGAWYQRRYRPQDDGQTIRVKLPTLRDAELTCDTRVPCSLAMTWDLGDGLTATVNAKCTPGGKAHMLGIPQAPGTGTCRAADGEQPLRDEGETILVSNPAVPVTIRIPDARPDSCTVRVGDHEPLLADQEWTARVDRPVMVSATCAGVPALPTTVPGDAPATVELDWTVAGAWIDATKTVPDASTLWIVAEGSTGWTLPIPRTGDRFTLPPLPAGSYRMGVSTRPGAIPIDPLAPLPNPTPGTAVMTTSPGGLSGLLVLTEPAVSGPIPLAIDPS